MKSFVIWPVALLAMATTTYNKAAEPADACRSATRSGYEPGPYSFFLGFRVARVPADK